MIIGWDTETHPIAQGMLAPPVVCLTAAGGRDSIDEARRFFAACPSTLFESDADSWRSLSTGQDIESAFLWLAEHATKMVAHNAAFDLAAMMARSPELTDLIFCLVEEGVSVDTGVRQKLLDIANDELHLRRTSLAKLADHYLNIKVSGKSGPDVWRLRYAELENVPVDRWPAAAVSYAMLDADYARQVYLKQSAPVSFREGPLVSTRGEVTNELEQTRAALALHLMAVHGVDVDPDAVREFRSRVDETAARNEVIAQQLGFLRVNRCKLCEGTGWVGAVPMLTVCPTCKGLPAAVAEARGLYKTRARSEFSVSRHAGRLAALVSRAYRGQPPRTDKGSVKTDSDTLSGSGDPGLIEYSDTLYALKLRSTYVPILERGTTGLRITSSPNVLVKTGRTSWRDPNFQNPPRKYGFRNCFVPPVGFIMSSTDFASQELTCLAQVCIDLFGHSTLGDVINKGLDPHLWFACQERGWDYTWAEQVKGDPTHPARDKVLDARQSGKIGNFGIPGGLGVTTLMQYAEGYGKTLTANEAEDLIKNWKAAFPESQQYFARFGLASESSGPRGFTVKQVRSNRLRGGCTYTSGCNTMFQGLGADASKHAMWNITSEMYTGYSTLWPDDGRERSVLFGSRLWAFVHDEFLAVHPLDVASAAADRLSAVMEDAMRVWCPDVSCSAPPALMWRWLKSADTVRDSTGKLLPWKDEEYRPAWAKEDTHV